MSILAADDFNRADGVLGANWTSHLGTYVISSGAPQVTGVNSDAHSRWNAILPPADQWASVRIKTLVNSSCAVAVCCRVSSITANRNFYMAKIGGPFGNVAVAQLLKQVASTQTSLTTRTLAVVNVNDTLLLEVVGSTLTLKINTATIITVSDASHTSGYLGAYSVAAAGAVTDARLDDWMGGDFLNANASGSGVIKRVLKDTASAGVSPGLIDGTITFKYRSIAG